MPTLFASIAFVVFTLTRLCLLIRTGTELIPWDSWPKVLLIGLWFDLLVSGALASAPLLYGAAVPNAWRAKYWHGKLMLFCVWTGVVVLLFGAAIEVAFWEEFSTRLNFIAVDYLLYTHEVIGNIRQSYPLGLIFLSIGTAAVAVVVPLRSAITTSTAAPLTMPRRALRGALGVLFPVMAIWLGNIDQMRTISNAYAAELSGNGFFTFAAALRRNELDYDTFYETIPQEEADAILKGLDVERTPLSSILKTDMNDEASDPLPFRKRPKNVVLISVESLSASFVGAYGSSKGLTPNLDRLAREGLLFRRTFATGTRTVRGLEAMSLGTPPVPGQAIVRRPNNEHLSTIGNLLRSQGFSTLFIYGGYGYFDNMNAYFSANDYEIVDRNRFSTESVVFENIWGVADEVLYANAIDAINRTDSRKPFFAHIMTTSNHRPFTYPDGRIDIPSPGGREGAVKYTDYAIGEFIRQAEKQPWFADTLFVIIADHCASAAGKTKLPVKSYLIPLIFYAPQIVQPGTYDAIVSQIDLMPTLVELLGKRGDDHFFGRSYFDEGVNPDRAFISNYESLGYLREGLLTVLLPKKRVEYYRVDSNSLEQTPAPADDRLRKEAIAYYQTAARAFKSGALRIPK